MESRNRQGLNDGDQLLYIGCAMGIHRRNLLASGGEPAGLDYVGDDEQAKLRAAGQREDLLGSLEFAVGDITNRKRHCVYDKVVVIRVLIIWTVGSAIAGSMSAYACDQVVYSCS